LKLKKLQERFDAAKEGKTEALSWADSVLVETDFMDDIVPKVSTWNIVIYY
jgi:hypothetical protein